MGSCDLSDIDAPEEIDANDSEGEEEDVLVESEAEEECKEEGGGGQDERGRRIHRLYVPSDEVLSMLCAGIKPCVQSGPTKVHTMLSMVCASAAGDPKGVQHNANGQIIKRRRIHGRKT